MVVGFEKVDGVAIQVSVVGVAVAVMLKCELWGEGMEREWGCHVGVRDLGHPKVTVVRSYSCSDSAETVSHFSERSEVRMYHLIGRRRRHRKVVVRLSK